MLIGAVIVAGGQGRRFGSPLKCRPLLPRLVRALRDAGCARIVIAGNHDGLAQPGCLCVRDAQDGCGPLGGVVAGLEALAGCHAALIVAGDLRRLRAHDCRRLIGAWRRTALGAQALACSNGRLQPALPGLLGILPAAAWPLAAQQLAARRFGMHRLWRAARARPLWFPPERLRDRDHLLGMRAAPRP